MHQPGANHAPRASVTQVNHSVHTLSTFLRIRADPSMAILLLLLLLPILSEKGVNLVFIGSRQQPVARVLLFLLLLLLLLLLFYIKSFVLSSH